MKQDCFYKFKVTKIHPDGSFYFQKKYDTWYYGYFPYKMILREVQQWYKSGADCVELEMITQEQFDKTLPTPFDKK